MDPAPPGFSSSELDLIPFLPTNPMLRIEPQHSPPESKQSGSNRTLPPYPNPSPILVPVNAVPIQHLSPDPDDDGDGYGKFFLSGAGSSGSYIEVVSSPDDPAVPTPAEPGISTAIVPAQNVPGASTSLVVSKKRKKHSKKSSRSAEMVRVSFATVTDLVMSRDLVRRTRITFESLKSFLISGGEKAESLVSPGTRNRPDARASELMLERNLWLNRGQRIIGTIPGINIGDVFFYRMELCVVGLHGQTQAGIDFVGASQKSNDEPIATSIVVSGGYEDDDDNGNELVYTGHGGRERNLMRHSGDQKLEGGNLALERCMKYGIEVRVVRGCKSDLSPTGRVYVYDGLYTVVECWAETGKSSFMVYKYKLVRIEGQDEMGSVIMKFAEDLKKSLLSVRPIGNLSHDISKGREKLRVSLFNDIDDDREPLLFNYLVCPKYSDFTSQDIRRVNGGRGCHCVSNCSVDCYCAARNGGEFPYDGNGILLRGKPVIYECGTHCRCPSSCSNRVSQNGVRNRLEVFRSIETGWGVRSLDLIPAGAFICEFSGKVLTKQEAEMASMNDASLIHPSQFPARWVEWGDMSDFFPEYIPASIPSLPALSFSINVSEMRNAACYLSHSCVPNVFLQFVLFDHYNESYPHLMVFAMENIPPMRELSIDYGVSG